MKILFLMDPLETVVMDKDTTFILMIGARRRGHDVYYLPKDGITFKNGELLFDCVSVRPQEIAHTPFIEQTPTRLSQKDIHAVFIRTDPPFNTEYLMHTWLLDQLPAHIPVINSPHGIRTVNEKIWASRFRAVVPRTLISRKRDALMSFLHEERNIIVKPTDSYGGGSVFLIKEGDKNSSVILETLTGRWNREVIAQQYIPDAQVGDKRVLLLNGEPLGAVLRVHSDTDHRNNFFAGGKPVATELTEHDRKIIDMLKPELQELGLYFVGIDIIGKHLIEVNVTSPTCMQEMNRLYHKTLEDDVIRFTENLIDQSRRKAKIST